MIVVFMGTPEFAVPSLNRLKESGFNIPLVITQLDKRRGRGKKLQFTPVKEKALELGIEVFQPKNVNSDEAFEKLNSIKPDLIVVVAYGQILDKEILELPKYGCINVHASLLPKYRGAAPINWAIIDGEMKTGVTIMDMEEGLDTGDMILKTSIPIEDGDDYITIHDKLSHLGGEMLIKAINLILEEKAIKEVQDHSLSNYAPMIFKDAGKIDWNKKAVTIKNLVRGLKPWPSAYTDYKGETIKIHKVRIEENNLKGEIGEILSVDNSGIYVKSGDNIIVIEEVQFPNKKKMHVKDYLAGNSIEVGIILN
jgi:methionyl-tRNA formyltransferase